MATAKLIFPVVLRQEQARIVERAKKLEADGTPNKEKRPSRSKFMREAILAEAERRIAKAQNASA